MKKRILTFCAAVAICSAGVAHAELICGSDPYFAARNPELCQKLAAIDAQARASSPRMAYIIATTEARLAPLERARAEVRETERKCAEGFALTFDASGGTPWWYGMTDAAALKVWCQPDHIQTTVLFNGTHEQWVYPGRGYLYFDNGRLTAIQRQN